MLVKILKPFPCAIDELGVSVRETVAEALEDIRDDLVPGLLAEGYVELSGGVVVLDGAPQRVAAPVIEVAGEPIAGPADGLTDVEINADLEALKVDFHPGDATPQRLAQRNEARAARDANPSPKVGSRKKPAA